MAEPGHAYRQMQSYNAQYQSLEEARAFLDLVHAAGTQVAIYPYPDNGFMSPSSVWSRPLTDEQRTQLRERIRALKDHPGLFAWYIADEPELRPTDPRRTDEIYRIISEEDPHHPCIMLNDTVAGIFRYAGGGDVLMPDPYPTFLADGHAAQPIQKVGAFMDAAVEAADGWRAVWITPQGFNYGDYGRENNRVPSFTELRNMTWQAIAHGARGFLWYTYSQVPNYPSLRLGMPWLSYEVDALRAAIVSDDAQIELHVEAQAPQHLHLRARRLADGQLLLIAVITDTTAQDVAITLCPASATDSLFVVDENRSVALAAGGVLHDRFGPYATHLYTTAHIHTDQPDLFAIQAAIDSTDAARHKPGNVAFEAMGTTVEVSSESRYGSTPGRLFDGVPHGMRWRDPSQGTEGDWVTIRWPSLQQIGRFVVVGNVLNATPQVAGEDGAWRDLACETVVDGETLTVRLENEISTDALQLQIDAIDAAAELTVLYEIEAYSR